MDDRDAFVDRPPARRDHARPADAHLIGDEGPSLFEHPDPHPSDAALPWPNYDHVDPIGTWRERGSCTGLGAQAITRRLCELCPVRWWCLDYALRTDAKALRLGGVVEHGTWGGFTRTQRRRLLEAHNLDPDEALIAAWRDAQ